MALSDRPGVHVVTVTDRAFLPWCACTILSCAAASHDVDLTVHVVVGADVDENAIAQLSSLAQAHGATFQPHFFDERQLLPLPSKGAADGHRISWARVLLGEILGNIDRVIYLDADTLVRHSVGELWTQLDGAPIAAVTNITDQSMHAHVTSLGVGTVADYFNAGVLVIDLDEWRRSGAREQIFDLAAKRGLPWYDQDGLNLVYAGLWQRLHPRWNAMNSFWGWPDAAAELLDPGQLDEARRDPAVLHFEGPTFVKPWHYLSQHPFRHEYRATLARTPWSDRGLDRQSLANRAIALLPASEQMGRYVRAVRVRDRLRALTARARR